MPEKVKGLYWNKRREKWQAYIKINGERIYLGSFDNYEDAVKARKEAEIKYGYIPLTPAPKLKHKNDLTQEMLKTLLYYDPDTGDFTWLISRQSCKIGDAAGTLGGGGYRVIKINYKPYKAHRLAFLYMTGKFPEDGLQTDHINHVKNDNRWVNLRLVTQQANLKNKSMYKNNNSGQTGVCWESTTEMWQSVIMVDGKREHLGLFDNLDDAIAARKSAEIKYGYHENHGNPKLNPPIEEESHA